MASYNCLYPEPVEMDGAEALEWGSIEWASEGAFSDSDHDDRDPGERRFYSIAIQRGHAVDSELASVAVLGVTRDLEIGIERRYPATRDGDWELCDRESIPASICARPPEDSTIPKKKRERFRRVLERAHDVDPTVREPAEFDRASEIRADGGRDLEPRGREAFLAGEAHYCDICKQTFEQIDELANHSCTPIRADGGCPEHVADCEDCSWSYSDPDLVDVSDEMDRHARKEMHDVDLERAVATDGGRVNSVDGTYRIGDAIDELRSLESESAAVVCLDDAWARPKRGDAFGVEYPTHGFANTKQILSECRRVLKPGGWLIADADDWLLPKLLEYLTENWGNAAETYQNGYRKVGGVTLTSSSGDPDRSTPGMYGSTGGYPVVFAHKGETDRRWSESARQVTRRPQERYDWGSVKPIDPYETWIDAITEPSETVVVPCAGTAPAAIAAERLGREWIAIDCEPDAKEAYRRRRESELAGSEQTLLAVADGGNDCTLHTATDHSFSQSENSSGSGGGSR